MPANYSIKKNPQQQKKTTPALLFQPFPPSTAPAKIGSYTNAVLCADRRDGLNLEGTESRLIGHEFVRIYS